MATRVRALALAALLVFAATHSIAHHAPGPIKIAAILSLSGPAAEVGTPQLKTLQLYIDRLNSQGGLLTHKVELNYADDAGDPKKAAAAAVRLGTPENADILIGGSITPTAFAIDPVMLAAKIPFISIATGTRSSDARKAWVFTTAPTESMAVLRVFDDLVRNRVRRLALVTMDTESGKTVRRDVLDYTNSQSVMFRKTGVALAADLTFPPTDVAAAARALEQADRARDVDAVLVIGFGNAAAAIARRHRELGSKARLYFSHAAAGSDFLALAGPAADGVRMAVAPMTIVDLLPDGDAQKKLILDYMSVYKARYGENPAVSGGYALDALMLAINSIQVGKSLDFTHMRQVLEGTRDFVGVTSTYNFWASDHRALDPKSLRLVEVSGGGALKLIEGN